MKIAAIIIQMSLVVAFLGSISSCGGGSAATTGKLHIYVKDITTGRY
jgi:hypothetical protein